MDILHNPEVVDERPNALKIGIDIKEPSGNVFRMYTWFPRSSVRLMEDEVHVDPTFAVKRQRDISASMKHQCIIVREISKH